MCGTMGIHQGRESFRQTFVSLCKPPITFRIQRIGSTLCLEVVLPRQPPIVNHIGHQINRWIAPEVSALHITHAFLSRTILSCAVFAFTGASTLAAPVKGLFERPIFGRAKQVGCIRLPVGGLMPTFFFFRGI